MRAENQRHAVLLDNVSRAMHLPSGQAQAEAKALASQGFSLQRGAIIADAVMRKDPIVAEIAHRLKLHELADGSDPLGEQVTRVAPHYIEVGDRAIRGVGLYVQESEVSGEWLELEDAAVAETVETE